MHHKPVSFFRCSFSYRLQLKAKLSLRSHPTSTSHHWRATDLPPVTAGEVMRILVKAASRQSELDLEPTWLVQRAGSFLAPVIAAIYNVLFQQVALSCCCKKVVVCPLPKKHSIDPYDQASYRLISNLSFLSSLLRKPWMPRYQRTYIVTVYSHHFNLHTVHTTMEAAVIRILSDTIGVIDASVLSCY